MSGDHTKQKDLRLHLVILRCQSGDELAFEWLYDHFHERTLGYLEGILDAEAAWDVQQEVWVTIYLKISELTNPGGFRTWLFRITRNNAIDHLRRIRRRSELISAASEELSGYHERGTVSDEEEWKLKRLAEIETATEKLSPPHREVVILRYREGMSYQEIAVIIGCPVGTVRSRIHHAHQNLESLVKENCNRPANVNHNHT